MDFIFFLGNNEQIEQEGWLLKRGAGYDNDHKPQGGVKNRLTKIGYLDNLLAGKAERKRYFILVKTKDPENPSAHLHFFQKRPKIQKDRMKAPGSPGAAAPQGAVSGVLSSHNQKGKIPLTPGTTRVSLEEGATMFRISSTGRTYYLRPPDSKNHEAEIAYTAGQWVENIRNALAWLSKESMRKQTLRNKNSSHEFFNRLSFNMGGLSYEGLMSANGVYDRAGSFNGSFRLSYRGSRDPQFVAPEKVPETLSDILSNELYKKEFSDFLEYARATENLKFWEKVNEYEEKVKLLQSKSRKGDIRTFAKSIWTEYIEEESTYQVNISSAQRNRINNILNDKKAVIDERIFEDAKKEIFLLMETNFFQRFYKELMKRTGCFASLYHSCDMDGYDVVIGNHFGSVMAESQRLKTFYTGRVEQVRKQIKILQDSLRYSHDVAVPQFETTTGALLSLYETSMYRLEELMAFNNQLQEAVDRLDVLNNTMKTKLDEIVDLDKLLIRQFEEEQKNLDLEEERERAIDMCYRMLDKGALSSEDVASRLKQYKVTVENIHEQLEDAREKSSMLKNRVVDGRIRLKEDLSVSLNDLEKLDLHRLHEQQEIVQNVLTAENYLNESITQQLRHSSEIAEQTDIESDLQGFSRYLNGSLTEKVFAL
mmetsp:Transcript_8300/g.9506  ORF Transcript_8300/g.9506 Transcript_8300/m.9506 type:complete len:652 (+) Transcript_8300:229-2184(+)